MQTKRILSFLLAGALTLTGLPGGVMVQAVPVQTFAAESLQSGYNRYFYDQLTQEAKVFYEAIDEMYTSGLLKTGNGDFELVANGYISQEQAEAYAFGGAGVLEQFGAARDAFYMDHTDIFYVDTSSLSIRVTASEENGYRVYIGTGRRDSYYAEGFTSAGQVDELLAEYEQAVADLAAGAATVPVDEGESQSAKQVEFVHDHLTLNTSYHLENTCKPENIGFIRTAYGALVAGEAVCEGYARAFKAVMDELNIPCVLVNGVYMHEDQPELHMWAEVLIEDQWYGVDVTMDDPVPPSTARSITAESSGVDGYESHEYLLVGSLTMDVHHKVSGIISEANYEFSYPTLMVYNYGVKTLLDDGDLNVRYSQDGELDGERVDVFYVSYKGLGVMKAREQGYYILVNDEDTGWYYIAPEYYPALVDSDTELLYPLTSQIDDVQFAVTDIPFEMTTLGEYEIIDQTFYGTEDDFLEASGVYYNSEGGYEPPPYPKYVTPTMTAKLEITGGAFHISITYNDLLVPVEGEEQGIVMTSTGRTALEYAKVSNFAWDGESTVTFDFWPSEMYADDNSLYYFTLSGLVGEKSGKAPVDVTYAVAGQTRYCGCYKSGFNWSVFGQPSLIDNSDMSLDGWKTADGTPIEELEALKHRMVLVATTTNDEQTETMNDMIAEENSTRVLKSETYNINLTICQKMVVETGMSIKVSVGFPEGYGPEDAGVTFKAYHFSKDDDGNIIGVEEIPCILTQYGLIVECRSFSPYAIVAVESDGTQADTKALTAVSTTGGTVSGLDGIKTLSEGESITLHIEAGEGNAIESVTAGETIFEITDSNAMELTIGYDDIKGDSCIVDVKFVAQSVLEKEAERGETAVQVNVEAVQNSNALPLGDLNDDGKVDASDAAMILVEAALLGSGQDGEFNAVQNTAADVNMDGEIDSSDASVILAYAAAAGSGDTTGSLEKWIIENENVT